MIGPEWDDLARDADELLYHFPGKSPEWWAALNAALAMQILEDVIALEPHNDEDDDKWKR